MQSTLGMVVTEFSKAKAISGLDKQTFKWS
jgi:hypothetical protein